MSTVSSIEIQTFFPVTSFSFFLMVESYAIYKYVFRKVESQVSGSFWFKYLFQTIDIVRLQACENVYPKQ